MTDSEATETPMETIIKTIFSFSSKVMIQSNLYVSLLIMTSGFVPDEMLDCS